MAPNSKKLSQIEKFFNSEAKSLYSDDVSDLCKGLDACALQFRAQPQQDGLNLVQPLSQSEGCYDFSSMSDSLSNISTLNNFKGMSSSLDCDSSSNSRMQKETLKINMNRVSRLLKRSQRKNDELQRRRYQTLCKLREKVRNKKLLMQEMQRAVIGHSDLTDPFCEFITEFSIPPKQSKDYYCSLKCYI